MSEEPLTDLEQRIQEGAPKDWAPDWARWCRATHAARAHLANVNTLTTENATLKASLETAKTTHATEIGAIRGRMEETEIKAIPGIVEPDFKLFRSKYAEEIADLPEAKRPTLTDWTKAHVEAEEPPRWIQGFIGQAEEPAVGAPEPKPAKPAPDPKRKPAPPPKGGFTPEQIDAMSPAEFKANREAINAQTKAG